MIPLFNGVKADKINVYFIYHNDMRLSEPEVCVTESLRKEKKNRHSTL